MAFEVAQGGRSVVFQATAGSAIPYGTLVMLNSADRIQAATENDPICGMTLADIDADSAGAVMISGAIRGPAETGQNLRIGQPVGAGTSGQEFTGASGGAIIGYVINKDPASGDPATEVWMVSSLTDGGTVPV